MRLPTHTSQKKQDQCKEQAMYRVEHPLESPLRLLFVQGPVPIPPPLDEPEEQGRGGWVEMGRAGGDPGRLSVSA